MAAAMALTMVCYDGTIQGSKTINSNAGLIIVHHLHRNDAYSLPTDFYSRTKSGIYVLVGEGEGSGAIAYIGEASNVLNRINQPDHKKKEWWTSVYILNPAGGEINRAIRLYIENKVINDSRIQRYTLESKKVNNYDPLSNADKISSNRLFDAMVDACGIIGFPLFVPVTSSKESQKTGKNPIFKLRGKKHEAFLQIKGGNFVLLPGTKLSKLSAKLDYKSVKIMRDAFANGEILKTEIIFKSPSAAAAFAAGVNLSGRGEWRHEQTGKSLGQWQDGE